MGVFVDKISDDKCGGILAPLHTLTHQSLWRITLMHTHQF